MGDCFCDAGAYDYRIVRCLQRVLCDLYMFINKISECRSWYNVDDIMHCYYRPQAYAEYVRQRLSVRRNFIDWTYVRPTCLSLKPYSAPNTVVGIQRHLHHPCRRFVSPRRRAVKLAGLRLVSGMFV